MKSGLADTKEALELALRIEAEGKKFYHKASEKSSNRLAKDLFEQLAKEEDVHVRKFQEIYQALLKKERWSAKMELNAEKGRTLKSLLAKAVNTWGSKIQATESELEAIKMALDMENKSYNFYRSRSEESVSQVEREFYALVAGDEQGHRLVLLDSYEYLSNPAGWFTRKEHWSLDGI